MDIIDMLMNDIRLDIAFRYGLNIPESEICRQTWDNNGGPTGAKMPTSKPLERFTAGRQPCQDFLRGDADIVALGEGNRRNLHQCPKCYGNRAWCDNCHSDHHDGGWETCKPGAYDYRDDD